MKNLNIIVNNNVATYTKRDGAIVCDNSTYTVTFAFDSEWAAYPEKTVRFKWNNTIHDVVILNTNVVEVPRISNATQVEIGVYASGSDYCTTTPAIVPCVKSILYGSGTPADPAQDVYSQIIAKINELLTQESPGGARLGEVTLSASAWTERQENLYSQVVSIAGVTENTQVDLTPDVDQLAIFYGKDITFVTENEDGVVTVYCIGQKPEQTYTIQVTMTEVLA